MCVRFPASSAARPSAECAGTEGIHHDRLDRAILKHGFAREQTDAWLLQSGLTYSHQFERGMLTHQLELRFAVRMVRTEKRNPDARLGGKRRSQRGGEKIAAFHEAYTSRRPSGIERHKCEGVTPSELARGGRVEMHFVTLMHQARPR